MTARTHDGFAFVSLVTIGTLFPPASLNLPTLIGSLIGAVVGALIPDLDQAGNRLWDLLPAGDAMGKVARRIFYKHRTITHSLLGVILFFNLLKWSIPKLLNSVYLDHQVIFVSIMVGYLSHLVADAFTKEGLPLLFPLRINIGMPPIEALRITTDSWMETYLVQPALAAYLLWFVATHQDQVRELLTLIAR